MDFLINLFRYLVNFIEGILAEASIVLLLLGLVFFLLGAVILVLAVHTWCTGQRVKGNVIGAVKDIRIKEKKRDGRIEEVTKETLFPIYEYKRQDGSVYQEKGSSGGSSVLKYKTGQEVNIIVCRREGFDDVYDANDYSPIIMSGVFLILGFSIMAMAANFYSSLKIGGFLSAAIIVFLLLKIITSKRSTKKSGAPKNIKHFNPDDVKSIEEFAQKR